MEVVDAVVDGAVSVNDRRTSGESSWSTRRARRAVEARWWVGKGIEIVLGRGQLADEVHEIRRCYVMRRCVHQALFIRAERIWHKVRMDRGSDPAAHPHQDVYGAGARTFLSE